MRADDMMNDGALLAPLRNTAGRDVRRLVGAIVQDHDFQPIARPVQRAERIDRESDECLLVEYGKLNTDQGFWFRRRGVIWGRRALTRKLPRAPVKMNG